MSIKITSVKCPDCGSTLPIEEGRTQVFCSYCGAKVIITNENEHIYRHIDEAGIKQAETNRMVRMRELDLAEKNTSDKKMLTTVWLAATGIVGAIGIILMILPDENLGITGLLLLELTVGLAIGGGTLIFKVLPEKEMERALLSNGGIKFPKALEPFSDQYIDVVERTLQSTGFNNITTINMHDITFGILQKPGKVETINVNGENITSGGKVYSPDVPITITYHGK